MTYLDIEASVLGSIIVGGRDALDRITELGVTSAMFTAEAYKAVFDKAVELRNTDGGVDPRRIQAELAQGENRQAFTTLLNQLVEITPTAANAKAYADGLIQEWRRRRAQETITEMNFEGVTDADEMFRKVHRLEEELNAGLSTGLVSTPKELSEMFRAYLERSFSGNDMALSTGFKSLDACIGGGLLPGSVYVLAARTSEGKTTLAIRLAQNVVMAGGTVLYISLEMTPEQVNAKRFAPHIHATAGSILLHGKDLTEKQKENAMLAVHHVSMTPWYMNTKMSATPQEVERMSNSLRKLDLIVIDHIGLMKADGRTGNRAEEMTMITRALKSLALSIKVPIIELAQFNREAVKRDNTPTMSDLKDSSSVEQDADVVWILTRSGYRQKVPKTDDQQLTIKCEKNRFGQQGAGCYFRANLDKDLIIADSFDPFISEDDMKAGIYSLPPESVENYG